MANPPTVSAKVAKAIGWMLVRKNELNGLNARYIVCVMDLPFELVVRGFSILYVMVHQNHIPPCVAFLW